MDTFDTNGPRPGRGGSERDEYPSYSKERAWLALQKNAQIDLDRATKNLDELRAARLQIYNQGQFDDKQAKTKNYLSGLAEEVSTQLNDWKRVEAQSNRAEQPNAK